MPPRSVFRLKAWPTGTVAVPAYSAAFWSAPPRSVTLFATARLPRSRVPAVTLTAPVPKAPTEAAVAEADLGKRSPMAAVEAMVAEVDTGEVVVADMAAIVTQLDAGPIAVVGHDWGSAVAYGLAILRPELVEKLVVLNGVHPGPFQRALAAGGAQSAASQYIDWLRADGSEEVLAAADFAKLRGLFAAHMEMGWLSGERLAAYQAEWARPGRMRGMVNWYRASPMRVAKPGEPLRDVPAPNPNRLRITCPHLLIWGTQDRALLPEATEGLETYAADLTRVNLPGADHWLHHQVPDAVAATILRFL